VTGLLRTAALLLVHCCPIARALLDESLGQRAAVLSTLQQLPVGDGTSVRFLASTYVCRAVDGTGMGISSILH
jgi:hypothetical protein